ncbi:MAG: TIGR02147 family protein [Fibrobacter sp.]|jgi:uncharacterized protein (TIGR02147 family)|nr:TIGR02147 family protein [Fibrobacter sp.]
MNVFAYYNYRNYLKDYYDYRKSVNRYFSYRAFAKKAGFTSSGLYLDLVKGRKSLTPQMLIKFVTALGLNERETKYFKLMVDFTHATDPQSKQLIFEKMSSLLPRSIKLLTRNQQEYYSKWYHIVVREALAVLQINNKNIQELALFLTPKITLPQAKRTIQLLLDLDLIEEVDGFYKPMHKTISSSPELSPLFVHEFQKQMMDLAKNALDHFSAERRNISCTTMSVSAQGLERIIHKIDAFRQEIIDIVRSDEDETMVCEFNIQFFPISKEKEPQ